MPFVLLTHHKCASTWLITYCAQVAAMNGLRFGHTHYSDRLVEGQLDIVALINADYSFVRSRVASGIHVIRNPLDLICSAYYSHLSTHSLAEWPELESQRAVLQSVSKPDGMMLTLTFLERSDFYSGAIGPLLALRQWDFSDEAFTTLRMEDVVTDIDGTVGVRMIEMFGRELRLPDAADFCFERFSGGRRPGEVDNTSHYRTGQPGTWRGELPSSAVTYLQCHLRRIFERYYAEDLRPCQHATPPASSRTRPQ
jgi:hypothetical protein